MHTLDIPLLVLALGATLALPVRAQSTEAVSTSSLGTREASRGQQDTRARQDDNASRTDSQTDANGWQAGQSSSANTQSDARLSADSFGALDTDHDGRISSTEAAASAGFNGRFRSLDHDGDGYVSEKEYREGLRATRTPTSAP